MDTQYLIDKIVRFADDCYKKGYLKYILIGIAILGLMALRR